MSPVLQVWPKSFCKVQWKGKQTRQTEEEVGRQHQGTDGPGVRKIPEGGREQRKTEETGCEITCGAPMTFAVKGWIMMMIMMIIAAILLPPAVREKSTATCHNQHQQTKGRTEDKLHKYWGKRPRHRPLWNPHLERSLGQTEFSNKHVLFAFTYIWKKKRTKRTTTTTTTKRMASLLGW